MSLSQHCLPAYLILPLHSFYSDDDCIHENIYCHQGVDMKPQQLCFYSSFAQNNQQHFFKLTKLKCELADQWRPNANAKALMREMATG